MASPPRSDPTPWTRRRLLATGLGASGAVLGAGLAGVAVPGVAGAQSGPVPEGDGPPGGTPSTPGGFRLFADDQMNFQALAALSSSAYGAAELGEMVTIVNVVNAFGAGYQACFDGFSLMADRVGELARRLVDEGDPIGARGAFLRAAQYRNQALFFVYGTAAPGSEPDVYRRMDADWREAIRRFDLRVEEIAVPYEGSTMPGWFFAPPDAGGDRRPTVILNNGSDGQNVDLWPGVVEATARGLNAVLFDGPGQGSMLFERDVVFRPDWNAVVTPVVDHLLARADVDPERIALAGVSMAGELGGQAAAFEHRLAALVLYPGVYDVWAPWAGIQGLLDAGPPEVVNEIWVSQVVPGFDATQRFGMMKRGAIYTREALLAARQGQVAADIVALTDAVKTYNNEALLDRITCPVLVTDYEEETFFPGQPRHVYDLIAAPKDYVLFTAADGAQYHDAPMAPQRQNQVIMDWLAKTLR